ncbi:MAG: adenylosuccinate lyase [Firmicutes bacterium]|nr:adenylosuccinate lyase [Bacillota bacterium]MDY4559955.1 adenylosuccinate lyase [Eubacteriales bacterium]
MKPLYENPLCTRYSSTEMQTIFSDDVRFGLWRRLWLALAKSEKALGLDITDEQIAELSAHLDDINYEDALAKEKEIHHDVMSHIYALGLLCPKAKPIIHLGATSCFVTDNSELIMMYRALKLVKERLIKVIKNLSDFALEYKDMPTLGFTHLQAAQLTTVGKRATLYVQELMMDLENVNSLLENFKLRGIKGTTGTQASFLELFNGDHEKVKRLNEMVVGEMGFKNYFAVSGQTYPRKYDFFILSTLSGIAQSASKFANDLRILQSKKEMEEPFGKKQVGSSAMAYKRNPMLSERICALSRYLISLPQNPAMTSSTQWFERTLDDSANRRLTNSEAFLTADSILLLMDKVTTGMVVYPKIIEKHVGEELPFMATENILMDCVKAGGDRQALHEAIRECSMEAAAHVKIDGLENDLIERLKAKDAFKPFKDLIDKAMDARLYIGRASVQTEEYVSGEVLPALEKEKK